MSAPNSVQEFVELCLKSGVVDEEQLNILTKETPATPMVAAKTLIRVGALTKFQASQLLAGKYKGLRFDRLKILDRIGSGGMGTVFLCEHLGLKRNVAVKVLPPELAGDEGTRERFFREARAAASLDHPNIVRVFDMNQSSGVHYLVMEFVDGQDLQTILNRYGPLHYSKACTYIAQAALGLQHAMEKGIVHRDIKPANLLVDKEGVVKILDMGLARFQEDAKDNLTARFDKGAVLGTADFMAPEQVIASSTVDIRADIYSLGVTLYTLINGKPPFGGSSTQKLMGHQTVTAAPLTTIRREVPKGLSTVVDKMIAKNPDDRYQTPNDVVDALTPWLEAETVTIESPTSKKRITQKRKQIASQGGGLGFKPFILIGVLGIVFAAAGLGVYFSKDDKKSPTIAEDKQPQQKQSNTTPITDPPIAPPPPKKDPPPTVVAFQPRAWTLFDAAMLPAGEVSLSHSDPTKTIPFLPNNWHVTIWRSGTKTRFSLEDFSNSKAFGFSHLEGETSSQIATKMARTGVQLRAGFGYRATIDYATRSSGSNRVGSVDLRFKDYAKPGALGFSLRSTGGKWKTINYEFRSPVDTPLVFYVSHLSTAKDDTLFVRSVKIEEVAAANRDLVSDDFTLASAAKVVYKGYEIQEQTGSLPFGYRGGNTDGAGINELTVQPISGQPALTIRPLEGGRASAVLLTPLFVVENTREYRVELEYLAQENASGSLRLDDGTGRSRLIAELPKTDGQWKNVSIPIWPMFSSAEGKIELHNSGFGKQNQIALRWLAVRNVGIALNTTTPPLASLTIDPKNPIALKVKGYQILSSSGSLPPKYSFAAWDKESEVELESGTFEGASAIKITQLKGKNSGMFSMPWLDNPENQQYEFRMEYQGNGPASVVAIRLATEGVSGSTTVGEGFLTYGVWRELRMQFQPPAGKKFRIEIHPQTMGADRPLLIKRLEIRPYQSSIDSVWTPLGRLEAANEKSFELETSKGVVQNTQAKIPFPMGWTGDSFRPKDAGKITCQQYQGRQAFVLSNSIGSNSVQMYSHQPIATIRKGEQCLIRMVAYVEPNSKCYIEHRSNMMSEMTFLRREIPPTDFAWKTFEFDYIAENDLAVYPFLFNRTSGDQSRVAIASYEFLVRRTNPIPQASIIPMASVVAAPKVMKMESIPIPRFDLLFSLNFAEAKETKCDISDKIVLNDNQLSIPDLRANCWNVGDTGVASIVTKGNNKLLAIQNVNGSSAQAWIMSPMLKMPANKKVAGKLTYSFQGTADQYTTFEIRSPKQNQRRILNLRLPPTGAQLKTFDFHFTAPSDEQQFELFFQNAIKGPTEVHFQSLQLSAAPVTEPTVLLYTINLTNQKEFTRHYKGSDLVDSQGDGDLPKQWSAMSWRGETTIEVLTKKMGTDLTIGLRNIDTETGAMMVSKEVLSKMQRGKRYGVMIEYRTEGNGRGMLTFREKNQDIYRVELGNTANEWQVTEIVITPETTDELLLGIFNHAVGKENGIFVKRLEVHEFGK